MQTVKKTWGQEEWVINCEEYCGKLLYIQKGSKSSIHYHKNKKETFYLLSGRVKLEVEDKSYLFLKGSKPITILPEEVHGFEGLEDSVIIEFSTHHEDSDTYRLRSSSSG